MYARVNIGTDIVESQIGNFSPDRVGPYPPPPPPPTDEPGIIYYLLNDPIDWAAAPSRTSQLFWNNGNPEWRECANIEQLRAICGELINTACRVHIEQGFVYDALGSPHLYPAKSQDQANLIGSVTDSMLFADDPDWTTPFWCADQAGIWEFRPHTRIQIQQVGRVGKTAIVQAMRRNEEIQKQIMLADENELKTIVWSI